MAAFSWIWRAICKNCPSPEQENILKNKIDALELELRILKLSLDDANLPVPVKKSEISIEMAREILLKIAPTAHLYLTDNIFYTVDIECFKKFIWYDVTNYNTYVAEAYDCDNFALSVLGNANSGVWADVAIFIAWSNEHAFNIMIDDNHQVWYIEPQTDQIEKYIDVEDIYKPITLIYG